MMFIISKYLLEVLRRSDSVEVNLVRVQTHILNERRFRNYRNRERQNQ